MTPTLELSFMKAKYDSAKTAARARRTLELEKHGKIVSRRASVVHKSKKDYNRKSNKVRPEDIDEG